MIKKIDNSKIAYIKRHNNNKRERNFLISLAESLNRAIDRLSELEEEPKLKGEKKE
jgi:hypothetical protein